MTPTVFYVCPTCRMFWAARPVPSDPQLRIDGGTGTCPNCTKHARIGHQ